MLGRILLLYYKLGTLWHSTEWDKLVAVFSSKSKSVSRFGFVKHIPEAFWQRFFFFFSPSLAAIDCLLQCVGVSGDVLFYGFLIAAFWMSRRPLPSPAPLPHRPHPSSRSRKEPVAPAAGPLSECCTQFGERILFLGPPICQEERKNEGNVEAEEARECLRTYGGHFCCLHPH